METVVVRLWVPTEQATGAHEPLRGIVEHVGSGSSAAFGDESELLTFMREASGAIAANRIGGVTAEGATKCTAAAANPA